jgi:hypothetical protein
LSFSSLALVNSSTAFKRSTSLAAISALILALIAFLAVAVKFS